MLERANEAVRRDVDLMVWSFKLQRIRRWVHQPYWASETLDAEYADRIEPYPRLETVAEHSWTVADSVLLLSYRFPSISSGHAVKLAVLHDKMEISVGDLNPLGRDGTGRKGHAFSAEKQADKDHRERAAIAAYLERIPESARPVQEALLFEALECASPEARFVKSVDKMLALAFILIKKDGAVEDRHLTFLIEFTQKNNRYYPALSGHSNELLRRIFVRCASDRGTTVQSLFESHRPSDQLPLSFVEASPDVSPLPPSVRGSSKRDRLEAALKELQEMPPARTGLEAFTQLSNVINQVEDAVWGSFWRPPRHVPPGTKTDRMYPVAPDSIYPVSGWRVDLLVTESEVGFISQTGAIEVQEKDRDDLFGEKVPFWMRSERVLFDRLDADGRSVWDDAHRGPAG